MKPITLTDELRSKYKRIQEIADNGMPILHACKVVGISAKYFYQIRRQINFERVTKGCKDVT